MSALTDLHYSVQPLTYVSNVTGGIMKPLDCSSAVLDLCVRKRPRTPSPKETYFHQNQHEKDYFNPRTSPSSTIMLSPSSENSSDTSDLSGNPAKVKTTRPFKAYPKNPLALALSVAPPDILDRSSAEAYAEFRNRMLATAKQNYSSTNKNMRRTIHVNSPQNSDPTYWEKRKKNNEAAKRSRDARRAKEDEIAIRCAFLEQENMKLRYEIARIRDENERYSALLYKKL